MSDWQNVTLAELGPITTGKTPPSGKDGYFGGHIPFVTPSDMNGQRYIDLTGRSLTDNGLRTVSRRTLPSGSILVSCIGSDMGKVHIAQHDCYTNQQINTIEVNSKNANSLFVYYNLSGRKQELQRLASGSSAQPILNKSSFSRIAIALPPVGDQDAIANVLGSLDDKIELNRRMNETLEAMAQAIFRDWFVDFGPTRRKLDGATDPLTIMGGLVQDTERAQALADLFPAALGDGGLPEGWENKPLLDQASWVNGAAYKNMHFSDAPDALPVVKIAELKNGVTSSTKRTNTALGERYRISDGELLFSWSGNPDTSIDAFVWIGGDAWLNQHIFAVRENGTRSRAALYVLLKALMPQFAELARNKQTTGLGHVTKEDMKRLEIAVAPGPVEAAFEEVITPIFNLIVSKLFENRTLAATRDLLLPKLMSGEIRLSEAADLLEAAQ